MHSPDDIEARLRSLLKRAEADVLGTDLHFRHLYDSDVLTRPIFCFGRVATARYITIGANPSADDFREGRWSTGDLADESFSYFDRVKPHAYFGNWEAAIAPLRLGASYRNGYLAHLDVSPRATKSLGRINQLGDICITDFLTMARVDAGYLFEMLRIVWPQLRGLFVAGTITKKLYLDEFLGGVGVHPEFTLKARQKFRGRAQNSRASSKLYDVIFRGRNVPLFFCPVGPSARGRRDQEYFQSQVAGNEEVLRSSFSPC